VHGITPDQVISAPTFADFWAHHGHTLSTYTFVAFNAAFDIYALQRALYLAGVPIPNIRYACAMKLSRVFFSLEQYNLKSVANHLGITFNHHNALEDAKATTAILQNLMERHNVDNIKPLMRIAGLPFSYTHSDSYDPESDKMKSSTGYVKPAPIPVGTSTYFQNKSVVFTGTLNYYLRSQAQDAVVAMGGTCKSSVSAKTDIVIVGLYEKDTLKPGASIGSKLEKTHQLIQQGYEIDILDENDFIEILSEGLDNNPVYREEAPAPPKAPTLTPDELTKQLASFDDNSLLSLSIMLNEELRIRNLL
jgi:DNA polymerase-3 subunit epsilon